MSELPTCCTGEDSSLCCPGPALRERLAEAWDEGWWAGRDDEHGWGDQPGGVTKNPYRD